MARITEQTKLQLREAFESEGFRYFFEKSTGEICHYPDHAGWQDNEMSMHTTYKKIVGNPDDYVEIQRLNKRDLYILMEDFTETVGSLYQQGLLMDALGCSTPYRSFLYKLDDLEMQDEWQTFKNERLDELVQYWLLEHLGIRIRTTA